MTSSFGIAKSSRALSSRLYPLDLVEEFRVPDDTSRRVNYGDTLLMLVDIGSADSELSAALMAAPTARGDRVVRATDTFDYMTVTNRPPSRPQPLAFPEPSLAMRLRTGQHFIVPLRKRSAANRPFPDRISIGRATNNDIVLRHESVSKFHAWVQCDADGTFFIMDAGSKNGVWIKEILLDARTSMAISDSSVVRFGSVATVLCKPETLAGVLRQTGWM